MADGSIVQFGGPAEDPAGLDLTGMLVGSEGTLAIVTKVWVRLTRDPQGVAHACWAIFESVDDATNAISEIIGAGIIPAALEMMDQGILVGDRSRRFISAFRSMPQAILLIEVDGLEAGLDRQRDQITGSASEHRAREVRLARDAKERQLLWKCRKAGLWRRGPAEPQLLHAGRRRAAHETAAHPASGLPRSARKYDVRIVNVFHAGDGNIHPILLFDERDPRTGRPGAGRQRRDSRRMHRLRRQRDGRAWHRRRKDRASCTSCSRPTTWT